MNRILLAAPLLFAACAHAPQPAPQPTHVYGCHGTYPLIGASYPNQDTALITLPSQATDNETTTHTLKTVMAASGVKYAAYTRNAAHPNNLIWWTKGPNAILYITDTSTQGYVYEKQLATCTLASSQ